MSVNPLVSISCATFNHAPYLRECLEGFLMQQCDFKFEILIHDDASTDGTRAIIEEYTLKYPDIFFPMFQTENQYSLGVRGMMARFNFPRCKGKYIALCEGDDTWTDPLKLQKQVNFLESKPDVAASFTNAIVCNQLNNKEYHYNKFYKLEEGVVENRILFEKGGGIYPTCTLMYRADGIKFPLHISEMAGDELLLFIIVNYSKVAYQDFISATYNRWNNGVFSSIMNNEAKLLAFRKSELLGYEKLLPFLNHMNKTLLKIRMKKVAINIIKNDEFSLSSLKYIKLIGIKPFIKRIM